MNRLSIGFFLLAIEVGVIEAQQESAYSVDGETSVFSKLRQEAASRGCDGLVVTGGNDAVVGQTGGKYGGGFTPTLRGYRATCIVYKDINSSRTAEAADK